MTSQYDAAVELEKSRQALRENQAAGKATQEDAERVKRADKAYTDAKANKK
jgi:hypothetical protein